MKQQSSSKSLNRFFQYSSVFSIKVLFSTLVAIISCNAIWAQSYELGALAGFNISNVVGADVNDNGNRLGMHLGGYAHFEIDEKWGLRPELILFSQKGTTSGKFHTAYLDIPLMGTYKFDEHWMAMAGLQLSFLYQASVDDGSGRGNITDFIRSFDLGVIFAGWYQIDEQWGVGARIVPGLSRVGADGNERTFNFNVQLSAGYRFM